MSVAEHIVAGRYAIVREIGRGGMAIVSLARDLTQDRLVALKMLRVDIATPRTTERFLREVAIARTLSHPRILPLFDSGMDGELPFYVMPFVEGETLRQRLKRERNLPVDEAIALTRDIAGALSFAHEHGVLHRDVTPSNILLSDNGPFLADFGIARTLVAAEGETLTSTGIGIGTPEFMSPEQGAGDKALDERGDLYSLASVLYYCLAGEAPFTGPSAQAILARKVIARAPGVRELRPAVPPHVEQALRRALEPVPADRFRTVRQFCDALTQPVGSHYLPGKRWRPAAAIAILSGAAVVIGMRVSRDAVEVARRDVDAGHLTTAIGDLRRIVARAPGNAAASLLLAQALLSAGEDTASDWRKAARAAAGGRVPAGDSARARGLALLADARYPSACDVFRHMLATNDSDLAATLDLAECIARDNGVVPDGHSPSGWRFRASWSEATKLYQRLIDQLPPGHEARATASSHMPAVLRTEWGQYRGGKGAEDSSLVFGAFPTLERTPSGDSIAYVPHLLSDFRAGAAWMDPPSLEPALAEARATLRAAAVAWTREEPNAAASHELLAKALELDGEVAPSTPGGPSALSEIAAARKLTVAPLQRLHLQGSEVRIRIKRGDFAAARALADSTIAQYAQASDDHDVLAPLLALTAHARQLAALMVVGAPHFTVRLPSGRPFHPHPVLGASTLALGAYAELGGPLDSITAVHARVEREIQSYVAPRARDSVRTALLAQPLSHAAAVIGPAVMTGFLKTTTLIEAQKALARHDARGVRVRLDSLLSGRSAHAAAGARLDEVLSEAWLRVAIGDSTEAARQLDEALNGLPALGTLFPSRNAEAGALGRAMILRAKLAKGHGDVAVMQRWSDAARALLRGADPELQVR